MNFNYIKWRAIDIIPRYHQVSVLADDGGEPTATYVCVNYALAVCPKETAGRSIVVNADIGDAISAFQFLLFSYPWEHSCLFFIRKQLLREWLFRFNS